MELILVVVISAGMAGNSQNGVSRSLRVLDLGSLRSELVCNEVNVLRYIT